MAATDPSPRPADAARYVPFTWAGRRLDGVLAALFPERTPSALERLVRRGRVRLGRRRVARTAERVEGGEELRLLPAPDATPALPLLHADAHVAAFDKPAGLVSHATAKVHGPSAASLAADALGPLPDSLGAARAGLVHRLDRETSGVLLVARDESALALAREEFRARRVRKTYLAFAAGAPPAAHFTVERPLGPAAGHADRQRLDPPTRARDACTELEVLERWEHACLLACRPLTGRRHQIRLHLRAAGLALLGDGLYGPPAASAHLPRPARHALHASALECAHPAGGRLEVAAPLPPDLAALRAFLRNPK